MTYKAVIHFTVRDGTPPDIVKWVLSNGLQYAQCYGIEYTAVIVSCDEEVDGN